MIRLVSDKSHSIPGTVQTDSVFHPACCRMSTTVPFLAVKAQWREDSGHMQVVLRLRMREVYLN